MTEITFPTVGGEASGYLAEPESGAGCGVIVLQEWWGLDDHVRSVCDRLGKAGFFALAPDLYHGETTAQPDEAEQRMMALSMDQAEKEMSGAVEHLAALDGVNGKHVGAVGFCLGGGLSLWAAATNASVGAAVVYYYVMPHGKPNFSNVRAPVLGHFGTSDEFVSLDDAQALEAQLGKAGVDTDFEYYVGAGHAFFNDTNRLGTYDAAAAEKSWERTIEFLRKRLDD
jgi:carboxymethylenebutenolidase